MVVGGGHGQQGAEGQDAQRQHGTCSLQRVQEHIGRDCVGPGVQLERQVVDEVLVSTRVTRNTRPAIASRNRRRRRQILPSFIRFTVELILSGGFMP